MTVSQNSPAWASNHAPKNHRSSLSAAADPGAGRRVRFSLFSHAKDNKPSPVECSWEHFVAEMSTHDFSVTDKLSCPAFSPAEYRPGAMRGNKGVVALHMLVLDLDEVSEDDVLGVCATIEEIGCAGLLYTSWSHATKPWRCRVVIPLSRPVKPEQWSTLWPRANELFGGVADPQCVDPARLYFGAFAPAGTEDKHFSVVFEGEPLDVDLLVDLQGEAPSDAPVVPTPTAKLRLEQLRRFAQQTSRRKGHDADLAALLLHVCDGEVFAEPGERDTVIFQLAGLLGPRFVDYSPASIAVHFAPSLQLMSMSAPDCPTVSDVEYKIERAQQEHRASQLQQKDAEDAEYKKRIREAFLPLGIDRDEPYTDEELESFDNPYWLIQKDGSYYFFFNGEYRGPYTKNEAWCAGLRELAPASSAGVELFAMTRSGPAARSLSDLVRAYGTVAEHVQISISAQTTTYDPRERTIVEAACPRREIEAQYHPEIAEWLRLLGGEKHDKLSAWIKLVTRLDIVCRSLYLTGPKSIGKTLLALGLSRLWTTEGPAEMADVFAAFNDGILRCPLALADEALPKDWRGVTKHAELRRHGQETIRSLKRKFLPVATVQGATRSIITANNHAVLESPGRLTRADAEAVAARVLHIDTPAGSREAAEFLAATDTSGWVDRDMIAQHALWLAENHEYVPHGRFAIDDDDERIIDLLIRKSGVNSAVCHWLVAYLLHPTRPLCNLVGNELVQVRNGRLLVNSQAVYDGWDGFLKNEKCPSIRDIADALDEISDPRQRRLGSGRDRRYFRVIKTERLIAWAKETGLADAAAISAVLRAEPLVWNVP